MSSKAISPHGKVTQGDFSGLNVYVWEENKSLKIIQGVIDRGLFAAPFYEKATISSSTVERYQLISTSQQTGVSDTTLGATALFLGKGVAKTIMNAVQVNYYTVAIYFKDGKKCVIQINDYAYNTLNAACFVL